MGGKYKKKKQNSPQRIIPQIDGGRYTSNQQTLPKVQHHYLFGGRPEKRQVSGTDGGRLKKTNITQHDEIVPKKMSY